jgi:hypothetical protein
MASIVRSYPTNGQAVTMRLTKSELRLLLRALHALAEGVPLSEEHDRLIGAVELFFGNEASGSPREVTK